MAGIMDCPVFRSIHLTEAVSMLVSAVKRDDWLSVEDIDVPSRQRALSHKMDKACYNSLINTAPNTRSRAWLTPLQSAMQVIV